jgi:hypothetical protein
MSKTEYLQFFGLMIPTILMLAAAAISMADLAMPAEQAEPAAIHLVVVDPAWEAWEYQP